MFGVIRQRFRDAGTLKTLCMTAEQLANAGGQQIPGAEHFILSALALPDGTARRTFERLRVDPAAFQPAIEQQYAAALAAVGLQAGVAAEALPDAVAVLPRKGMYQTQASAQALMAVLTRQVMVAAQKANARTPLLGAHVLLAAAAAERGVAARALRTLGIDRDQLVAAASAEVAATLRSPTGPAS